MSCSSTGAPLNYSQYPERAKFIYYDPPKDPYNNLTNYGYNQLFQQNLSSLMPASWNNQSALKSSVGVNNNDSDPGQSDWYKYAPTFDGVQRYITSSGSARLGQTTRDPNGRIYGTPNLLRTRPPVPLSNVDIPFNNSSNRASLVQSLGCGPIPRGCS